MSLKDIVVGDYGQVIKLTFIDVDTNAAADISGYSVTQEEIFTDPSGTETAKTAAFDTDGTDGVIKYTIDNGLFDAAGYWFVRGRVASGAAELMSLEYAFEVLADTVPLAFTIGASIIGGGDTIS
jgi:hypothetical protein